MFLNASLLAQLKVPGLSPKTKLSQNIGLSIATIEYSRPSKKERKIFGGLLPYGEVWRTGANGATKFSFSKKVVINGQEFPKGDYSLLTIPEKKSWTIKWYMYSSSNWNTYKEQKPFTTFNLPVKSVSESIESLAIRFQNITLNSADVYIEWENSRIIIPVKVNEEEEIIASINKELAGPSSSDYFRAALYYHETKTDLNKALRYIQKVTESDKALFFQVTREALILKDLNKRKEAIEVAKRALQLSQEAKNKDFIKINNDIITVLK
jgi:tetratricopeptide (TPR) repeat protein